MPTPSHRDPEKAIQPFVPVGPGERTALYSHKELRAFASADPRNELDELSEPGRFRKDPPDTSAQAPSAARLLLGFLAGAAIGGALAALITPKTGPELRGNLRDLVRRTKPKTGDLPDGASRDRSGPEEGHGPFLA